MKQLLIITAAFTILGISFFVTPANATNNNTCRWTWVGWQLKYVCSTPTPSATPTPTPTVTPTSSPEPTTTPNPCEDENPNDEWELVAVWTDDPCAEPTPEPTPTPTEQPTIPLTNPSGPVGAPTCVGAPFVFKPGNALVKRDGDKATVQWQPTQGSEAHIYYYQNENPANKHAKGDIQNDGIEEINLLGSLNWTFGIQQKDGCATSDIVWVVDDNEVRLFRALPYNVH